MALPTFNDGDPIDASVIQSLVTKISQLEATIPTIGTAGTQINIEDRTADAVIPQIFGGLSSSVKIKPGGLASFTIDYSKANLTSKPKAIIITPVQPEGNGTRYQAFVVDSSVTNTSAKGQFWAPSAAAAVTAKFYFMVISHS
jgi:hypothetical protein